MEITMAYEMGQDAYKRGVSFFANPFFGEGDETSPFFDNGDQTLLKAWADGWGDAQVSVNKFYGEPA